jgi:hypothetical protein
VSGCITVSQCPHCPHLCRRDEWLCGALGVSHLCTNRDSNHFAGAIDEVAVFNRALAGDEIKAAYGVVHLSMPQAGLVAYWTFDEGVGRQSADKSGFGNHAILRRGTQWYGVPFFGPAEADYDGRAHRR